METPSSSTTATSRPGETGVCFGRWTAPSCPGPWRRPRPSPESPARVVPALTGPCLPVREWLNRHSGTSYCPDCFRMDLSSRLSAGPAWRSERRGRGAHARSSPLPPEPASPVCPATCPALEALVPACMTTCLRRIHSSRAARWHVARRRRCRGPGGPADARVDPVGRGAGGVHWGGGPGRARRVVGGSGRRGLGPSRCRRSRVSRSLALRPRYSDGGSPSARRAALGTRVGGR